jgi:Fe2+ or Zn2+ uptake regulation protein
LNKLQKCIETKRVNTSQSREVIYKIISDSDKCLSVAEIIDLASSEFPKKISVNTVYRHLRFFIECELIYAIQDDLKKAYYCLCRDEVDIFEVCPGCNKIKKTEMKVCEEMKTSEFITIHKKCGDCL